MTTSWRPGRGGHLLSLLLIAVCGCQKPAPATSADHAPAAQPITALASSSTTQVPPGGSLTDRLKAVQSGEADKASKGALPDWKPFPSGVTAITVPLTGGLVVVTAISGAQGDYESIKRILDVSDKQVQLAYSAEIPPQKNNPLLGGLPEAPDTSNGEPQKVAGLRLIDVADLQKAHGYAYVFTSNQTQHFPGTTAISTSTDVLNELRAGHEVDFHFPSDAFAAFAQLGAQALGEQSSGPHVSIYSGLPMYACALHRVDPADVAVPVLVNDQRVELPAVHAMCSLGDEDAHFYYLDQPSHPLTLAFQVGPLDTRLQVIKITIPPETKPTTPPPGDAGPPMERALEEKKPVEIYSLYFDFNRATIKPESEPTLKQIADILGKHPDWTLDVSGHTDNIGTDAFNLDLSKRRAAAVKDALVTRYHIVPDRLQTGGYGAGAPIDTNATLEGRARNRRVELQRR